MKILDVLRTDFGKIKSFFLTKEPAFISGIQQSIAISSAVLDWKKNPGTKTANEVVEAAIPKGKPWTEEAVKIAEALIADIAVCVNPSSWKGISLRLGAEILFLIDGGKLPTGIDGYLAEIQNIFIG